MADDNDVSVLELRGILQLGKLELLRIHERSLDVAERHVRGATPLEYATARLTAQDGRAVSDGWVGAAATTFDDAGTQPFSARSQLVRVLLPLPREEGAEPRCGRSPGRRRGCLARARRAATAQAGGLRRSRGGGAARALGYRAPPHPSTSCFDRMMAAAACALLRRQKEVWWNCPWTRCRAARRTVLVRLSSGLRSRSPSPTRSNCPAKGDPQLRLEHPQAPLGQPVTAFATVRRLDGCAAFGRRSAVDIGRRGRRNWARWWRYRTVVGTHVLRGADDVEPADG